MILGLVSDLGVCYDGTIVDLCEEKKLLNEGDFKAVHEFMEMLTEIKRGKNR